MPAKRKHRLTVADVAAALESIAPAPLAADWDNVGLLIGDGRAAVGRLMLCIDLTPAALDEAIRTRAAMVMAYHPVIFKPISRLTAERTPVAFAAARSGVAVYSMHTALDAVPGGMNDSLADVLGLAAGRRPIEPTVRAGQCKVVVFVPVENFDAVALAGSAAGAGRIGNYTECAFVGPGVGMFRGGRGSHPAIGKAGRRETVDEFRLEMIVPRGAVGAVCDAIRAAHGYEEPAIDIYPLDDAPPGCGMGRVGPLARPASVARLVSRIKKALGVKAILLAGPTGGGRAAESQIIRVAACGAGACGDMFRAAHAAGATFFLTGEMRHHDALAAAALGMTVCCVGHSNSERMGLPPLAGQIRKLTPGLDVIISKADRDPFAVM